MRPRAGCAVSWIGQAGKKETVAIFVNDFGQWITTGHACGWKRCKLCRKPIENSPFRSGVCPICYFYKSAIPSKEFWRLHERGYWLAPYNMGKRTNFEILMSLQFGDWRKKLRDQSPKCSRNDWKFYVGHKIRMIWYSMVQKTELGRHD